MKETYYKLNREKLEDTEDYTYLNRKIGYLVNRGILEEVQEEEELFHVEQNDKCYIHKGNVFEYEVEMTPEEAEKKLDEMQGLPESMKGESPIKTATEQSIDNMFGNPLEQIDSMIDGTKPFLNGMTPSIWLENTSCDYQKSLIIDDARWHATTLFIDILVEELKRKGSL